MRERGGRIEERGEGKGRGRARARRQNGKTEIKGIVDGGRLRGGRESKGKIGQSEGEGKDEKGEGRGGQGGRV